MTNTNVIILAAGLGTRLGDLTANKPKSMVNLLGKGLIEWQLKCIKTQRNVKQIIVVGGYFIEKLREIHDLVIENPEYAKVNMVKSLLCARDFFGNSFVVAYGDIIYNSSVIEKLLEHETGITVVVDLSWKTYWENRFPDILNDAESLKIGPDGFISSIGQKEKVINNIEGQYIGLIHFGHSGILELEALLDDEIRANMEGKSLIKEGVKLNQLYMTDVLQGLINNGSKVKPLFIEGGWLEIDTPQDLAIAEKFSNVSDDGLLSINR